MCTKGKLTNTLKDLENTPNDSRKMYEAVKGLKKLTPKQSLLKQTESGLTADEKQQAEIISKYFKNQFYKNTEPLPIIIPLTTEERRKATTK